jgi:hypothetical protein
MTTIKDKDIQSAAKALGRLGGLAKSEAKAKAVRKNAKLGGRPLGRKDKRARKEKKKTVSNSHTEATNK